MKKLSICSFLLLQFILYVAGIACAQQATQPAYIELPNQTMLNPAPIARPQISEDITIEDVWLKNGGVRVAFLSVFTPQQVYTAGYPWVDPASMPLLQPILPYSPTKSSIVRRIKPQKIAKDQVSISPFVQNQMYRGLSLTAPTRPAKITEPHLLKKKEDTAIKFDNLYSVTPK